MKTFFANFADVKLLAGIAVVSALTGVGVIPPHDGELMLAGLIGLSINTTTGASSG